MSSTAAARLIVVSTVLHSTAMAVSDDVAPSGFQLEDFEPYRRELTGYCYRMLGSAFEADDAVQETLVRAWRKADTFEGRSSLRSWVYRIATNVCLDMLRSRQRRAVAMDLGPAHTPESFQGVTRPNESWVEPIPDVRVVPEDGDPAEIAAARETIRLAFVTALQHLPAKQRAVLILCEVLKWSAVDTAELLDTTVAGVNSALQRARATLAERNLTDGDPAPQDAEQRELVAKYVDAFERYDMDALVALLHDDVVMSMPPYDFWLRGPEHVVEWMVGNGAACRGSRLVATAANGQAAFASYKPDPAGGWAPWSIQVLDLDGDRIIGHHNFLDTTLYEVFGLPAHLD